MIRHAVLVTGNGVADGQAECIIDEYVSGCEAHAEYLSISSLNDKRSHAQFP